MKSLANCYNSSIGAFPSKSSIILFTFLLFALSPLFSIAFAQQNYTPLREGEYEIKEEKIFFNPGAKVEGEYKAFYSSQKKGLVAGEDQGGKLIQDIEIRLISKVNTNLAIHAYIGNKSTLVDEQEDSFASTYPDEIGDSSSDNEGMDVVFREAYLEYNHNPNAQLKMGRQFINVGDQMGMIYQGHANAISQQCRIGTWCYYVGGARLANGGGSSIFWGQIDYPVFESGNMISDPWIESGSRQEVSFNVELLRVMYRGKDVPSSKTGMWVGERSTHHDSSADSNGNKYLYFDNDGVEYIGFNLDWNYYDFVIRFSWLNLDGKRKYYWDAHKTDRTFAATQNLAGNAYYLDMNYRLTKEWKGGITLFNSAGTEVDDPAEKQWSRDSTAFQEIQKGDFGKAFIYFNGQNGVGQGHSIANLNFYGIMGSYRSEHDDMMADLAYYAFERNTPVYYTNRDGQTISKSNEIGAELDVELSWRLEEKLLFSAFAAIFLPGNAYSANDNVVPVEDQEDFTLLGLSVSYEF